MKPLYWFLAAVALLIVGAAFGFFASPDSATVPSDLLDQYYVQAIIIGAVIGGVVGAGMALLAMSRVHSEPGESVASLHGRVIRWGLLGAVAALVLTLLVTLQIAYGRADWQVAPAERLSLVAGAGRYLGVVAAAWLCASVAYAILISTRHWAGRVALFGK